MLVEIDGCGKDGHRRVLREAGWRRRGYSGEINVLITDPSVRILPASAGAFLERLGDGEHAAFADIGPRGLQVNYPSDCFLFLTGVERFCI